MLAVLPLILGFQFLLGAVQGDMANQPDEPLQRSINRTDRRMLKPPSGKNDEVELDDFNHQG